MRLLKLKRIATYVETTRYDRCRCDDIGLLGFCLTMLLNDNHHSTNVYLCFKVADNKSSFSEDMDDSRELPGVTIFMCSNNHVYFCQ